MRPNTGRRQPKESFILPSPLDFQHRPRDSDASSRPSSVGIGGGRPTLDLYKDRSFQQSAVASINSFLSSHNFPISFKSTFPSAKDIHETLKFLLSLIDMPKLEDDLPLLLKRLGYPFKINKSILKSPAAPPHQWPTFLALIHWMVQIAKFHHHLSSSSSSSTNSLVHSNVLHQYQLSSYMHYIRGDDDAVEELDRKIREKIQHEKALAEEKLKAAKETASNLEAELERLRSAPSQKEVLEKENGLLEDDVNKFHMIIEELASRIQQGEKVLAEKEKQLEVKMEENGRICEENEELKRRVVLQTFNARDVERMKRELQTAERDVGEAELARNAWEDKCWELDTSLDHKFKDLQAFAMDCNQALKRLKIGNGIEHQLNPKGNTPAEIMGIDHKLTLKPSLNSFTDDIKKSSTEKLEELISHQQKFSENAVRLEGKRNQLAAVHSRIDEIEAQRNMIKKETDEYTGRCFAEAEKMLEDVQQADHDLGIREREKAEVLKASELKLQETIKQSEEEIQMHAHELLKAVDSISKYKVHVASKISEMKRDLSETASAISEAYRGSLPSQFGNIFNATRQLEKTN
ncbi:kinetochore protein NDC80 homolog [Gastrolobium bilobum]|uniref:kinetochore protein NDC80 homolog n=1 Tax=Gastrolobium bilobum TaxID=150636 RepID=UPI002AB0B087|nr:kinetochore protein NDC80 homolog [Gastrolobium bilobum]